MARRAAAWLRAAREWLVRALVASGPDVAAHALLLAAAAILLFPALHGGFVRWEGDTKYFYFPLLSEYAAALKAGRLPLWEPGLFGGYPLFADGETGMLYPPTLLALRWLAPATALVTLRLVRFALAGSFTYAFLRATGLRRLGALVGGLVFMLSGFMVAQIVHENLDSGMVWLPLTLALAERAVRAGAPRRYLLAIFAGVALGVQALAVHVQVCVFTALVLFPYVYWRALFRDTVRARLPGRLLIATGLCTVIALVAGGLSAVQMLPLLDLASRAARGEGIALNAATINSVTPFRLLTLAFPLLLKKPDGLAFGYWVDWDVTIYVGLPALFLAALAVALRRSRYVVFFAAVAGLALVLSLGRYGPPWVVAVTQDLLGDHGLRSPGRFSFLWSFAAAVLAAHGADWLDRLPAVQASGQPNGQPNSQPNAAPLRLRTRLSFAAVCAALCGVAAGLLEAVQQGRTWLLAHPEPAQAWLERHFVAYDRTARLRASAADAYQALLVGLAPTSAWTVVWALSVVAACGLLVAWLVCRQARLRPALRLLTGAVVTLPLLAAATWSHPQAAVAATIEPHAGSALFLRDALAPPGSSLDSRPLYRAYTSQPVYPYAFDVKPNALLPLGVQEAGGYSSLSSQVNLAYSWASETTQGRMLDAWNARYYLWPSRPNPEPSYELTSFHPLRPLLAGTATNAGAAASFRVPSVLAENVRVIATLRDAWDVPAGSVVAWITATDDQGQRYRWPLRNGIEVGEATAGPPVTPGVDYDPGTKPLPVFSLKESGADGKPSIADLYYAKLPLPSNATIVRLSVQAVPVPEAPLAVLRVYGLGVGRPSWEVQNLTWFDRERFTLVAQDDQTQVYRNDAVLPRAYLVPVAVRAPKDIIKEMAERAFDPARMVLVQATKGEPLEGPVLEGWTRPVDPPPGTSPDDASPDDASSASSDAASPSGDTPLPVTTEDALGRAARSEAGRTVVTRYAPDGVRIALDAKQDAWLFLSDTYDPSWHAYVDGAARPVRLANAMFRAVAVPAGKHVVEFRYEPLPVQRGAALSLATGLLVLALTLAAATYDALHAFSRRHAGTGTPRLPDAAPSVLP